MNDIPTTLQNRREFLRSAGRWAMLGGLSVLGWKLFQPESVTECVNENVCVNCQVYAACRLPVKKSVEPGREGSQIHG